MYKKKRYVSKKLRKARRKNNGRWNLFAAVMLFLIVYSAIGTTLFIGTSIVNKCTKEEVILAGGIALPEFKDVSVEETNEIEDFFTSDEWHTMVLPENPEHVYPCSSYEEELFANVMSAEGYGFWSYSDYLTLATVVMNRYEAVDFPNSINDVLMQPLQFEVVGNGRYLQTEPTQDCRQAVSDALCGKRNLNKKVKWFCTKEYYESAPEDDFFKTSLKKVYMCRNLYFFEEV